MHLASVSRRGKETRNTDYKESWKRWIETVYRACIRCTVLTFIGPCIIAIVEEWKTNLMSLVISFHFLRAVHVSDINISIIRSLRLCCWITSVVLFSVRCVLELWCGWFWVVFVLQAEGLQNEHQPRSDIK